MPKVSVIVPVYNTEEYLKKCLDSLLCQTLRDIEIIIIDDGSTDKSGEICDAYALKDKRIKVHHRDNQGLSSARNTGIILSESPYIMFVDSDDWVEVDFCKQPYTIAKENNADLVLFAYDWVDNKGEHIKKFPQIKEGKLSEAEALRYNVSYAAAVWLGLYRKEIFNNIKYPTGKYYEDAATTHRLIHNAKYTYLINKSFYNYRIGRSGSITTSPDTKGHPDLKEMLIRRINDLRSWGYEYLTRKDAFDLICKYGYKNEEQKLLVEIVSRINGKAPSDFSKKKKIMFLIFRISPPLFDWICRITGKRIE